MSGRLAQVAGRRLNIISRHLHDRSRITVRPCRPFFASSLSFPRQIRCSSDSLFGQRYDPTSLSADALFDSVPGDWNEQAPRRAVWGRLVVPTGDRVAVWSRDGSVSTIDGPSSTVLFGTTVQQLCKVVAGPSEFISVLRKDGEREILRGPTFLWQDPVEYQSVNVYRAASINTNEALVVYEDNQGQVSRNIVKGPAMFTPHGSNEWVQQFVWHGMDPDYRKHGINRKVQGTLRFTKLRLIPDQLYFDVEKVRTKDDALLMAKTMIFFQLDDIEKMIDNTHDAVSEIINSLSADIIERVSALSFDEFRKTTGDFNRLDMYPGLVAKAKSIGYTVSKVVFRGYEASDTLQAMHDHAIESRTQLRLDTEKEEQEQELKHFRLAKELERDLKVRAEEERVTEHSTKMDAIKVAAELKKARDVEGQKLSVQLKIEEQRLALRQKQADQARDEQVQYFRSLEEHYTVLKSLGVDLTKHLAEKPHRVVRFEHDQSGNDAIAVQYHMHDPSSNDAAKKP